MALLACKRGRCCIACLWSTAFGPRADPSDQVQSRRAVSLHTGLCKACAASRSYTARIKVLSI